MTFSLFLPSPARMNIPSKTCINILRKRALPQGLQADFAGRFPRKSRCLPGAFTFMCRGAALTSPSLPQRIFSPGFPQSPAVPGRPSLSGPRPSPPLDSRQPSSPRPEGERALRAAAAQGLRRQPGDAGECSDLVHGLRLPPLQNNPSPRRKIRGTSQGLYS